MVEGGEASSRFEDVLGQGDGLDVVEAGVEVEGEAREQGGRARGLARHIAV